MATYEYAINKVDSLHYKDSFMLKEVDLYGSSRLGTYTIKKNLYYRNYRGHINTVSESVKMDTLKNSTTATLRDSFYSRTLGWKQYEVCNHLGNVLVTLSDRRLQHSSNSSTVDWYEADVTVVQDYYAFGAPMPGRSWKDSITQTHDSCVSCALLKAKMKSYYTTNGDMGMKNKSHIASYLNSQFGFSQSSDTWFGAVQNCGLLKQWVRGVNALDDTYPYLFDFGSPTQYKVGTGNFTIEAWINITDTQSTGNTIIESLFDSASFTKYAGFGFGVHATRLQMDMYGLSGSGTVFSTGHMSINTWHHVAFVRSGSGSSTAYTFYIDGVAKGTGTLGANNLDGRSSWTNDGMSIMGAKQLSKAYNYQWCKLMDVRMHTRALSSTELSNIYNHPCDAPDTTNLKLWLPLKSYYSSVSHSGYAEGTYPGSTIKDYSKYGATGTYTKNTSRPYDIAWDWTFDTTCFVNGTAACQWKDYSVANGYRFAFNGMEKDDEVSGEGNDYTADFWQYDARSGRRWNIDMKSRAWSSPYACFFNNPIKFNDPSGNDPVGQQHTIKKGDTFWGLAKKSGGKYSVDDLRKWNPNADPTKLKIGSNINISDPSKGLLLGSNGSLGGDDTGCGSGINSVEPTTYAGRKDLAEFSFDCDYRKLEQKAIMKYSDAISLCGTGSLCDYNMSEDVNKAVIRFLSKTGGTFCDYHRAEQNFVGSDLYVRMKDQITSAFQKQMELNNGNIANVDMRRSIPSPPNVKPICNNMWALFGGTQQVDVYLADVTYTAQNQYNAIFDLYIWDDYGVSESDYTKKFGWLPEVAGAKSGTLGMWILQYQYGYKPYVNGMHFRIKSSGSF